MPNPLLFNIYKINKKELYKSYGHCSTFKGTQHICSLGQSPDTEA